MKKQYFHKLGRIGGQKSSSYYLTIPKEAVKELGWTEGRIIVVERSGRQRHLTLTAYQAKPKPRT